VVLWRKGAISRLTAFLGQIFLSYSSSVLKKFFGYSFLNTAIYCIPAGWIWGEHGFLKKLGAVDIAGSGAVHLLGGSSAFASALMLGPRLGRYDNGQGPLPLGFSHKFQVNLLQKKKTFRQSR